MEPSTPIVGERVKWMVRLFRQANPGQLTLLGESPVPSPALQYGRLKMPVWLQLRNRAGTLQGAFSVDGLEWTTAGTQSSKGTVAEAGLVLYPGPDVPETEVLFDRVALTTNQR